MEVFVFSYNRGLFLKNCLSSIRQCLPQGIRTSIVDDGSTDGETVEVLRAAEAEGFKVIHVQKRPNAAHGGLYPNMQQVISEWATEELVLFIQDDTQVVRPLDSKDLDYIQDFFEQTPEAAFLSPSLFNPNAPAQIKAAALAPHFPVYIISNDRPQSWYSAISIAHRGRLRAKGFQYGASEVETGRIAQTLFKPMGKMAHPFVAWLPFVPNYRGRRETLAMWLTRLFGTVGYFPFEILSQEQNDAFRSRDLAQLPMDERFLTARGLGEKHKPWHHNPVSQLRWIRFFLRLRIRLARRFQNRKRPN